MAEKDVELGRIQTDKRSSTWAETLSPKHIRSVSFGRSNQARSKSSTSRSLTLEVPTFGYGAPLTKKETEVQQDLIDLIVANTFTEKGSLKPCCQWYERYLQSKFKTHWHKLAPALVGLEDNSMAPASGDLVIVYKFVITVAKMLQSRKDVALVDIVDELDNDNKLKPQLDEERAIPNQLVFAAIGWLTMLYDAVPRPKADKLEVMKTSTGFSGYQNALVTRKFNTFKQGFDYIDLPFYSLLGRFGDLIPEVKQHQFLDHDLHGNRASEHILVGHVCYNLLQSLAGLKIEWVTSLSLHLELDSGKKTLKLFQYPSFCRLMVVERRANILSRLLNDHAARSSEDARAPDVATDELFEEILLSYRLLFGQDDRSWKAFSRMAPVWEEQRGRSSWETSWDCDPLLLVLCGRSCTDEEARQVYDDIDANEPANYYDPNTEFPFFGKRLLELQQLIKQYQPQDVRSLLNDRRDVAAWYTLRTNQLLTIFASITIFLMVLSLAFQVWQVVLAKQQLQQSPSTVMKRALPVFKGLSALGLAG